jgi:hypothetical protein
MKKIVKTAPVNNIVTLNEFNYLDKSGFDVNIKPIGLLDRRDGSKAFIMADGYCSKTFSVIAATKFENGNSYMREQNINGLKNYIDRKMETFDFYVFENSKELLRWLAE